MCAAISLMGQCSVFVRNREQFTKPPFNLKIDEAFVAQLTRLYKRPGAEGHGQTGVKYVNAGILNKQEASTRGAEDSWVPSVLGRRQLARCRDNGRAAA